MAAADDGSESVAIPRALQEALRLSPDNLPLRLHVAETVLGLGHFAVAEKLFRSVLTRDPASATAKLGLATAFFQQGSFSPALVLVEDLLKAAPDDARLALLHARLLVKAGEGRAAARAYGHALELDPTLADPAFEEELGNHYVRRAPAASSSPPPEAPPPAWKPNSDPDETEERGRLPEGDLSSAPTIDVERPSLTFADVGGMERVKEEVRMKIILPLQKPELFRAYGKKIGGGLLLYGPPGCGKTYLARATAGEVRAHFIAVGITEVLDMWIGQSEKNLHQLFETARAHRPCVLFFDEVDALGASRTDMLKSAGRHLINQFLAELDGVASSNEGILILAATNTPWHLDPAFRRPGRFDRILFVPPPDRDARAAILRVHLSGKPCQAIDAEAVAKKTEDFSGADLRAIVDTAVEQKLREAMKSGHVVPLTTQDLLATAKTLRPTVHDWFGTAKNYALYANQSGLYDEILAYLKLRP